PRASTRIVALRLSLCAVLTIVGPASAAGAATRATTRAAKRTRMARVCALVPIGSSVAFHPHELVVAEALEAPDVPLADLAKAQSRVEPDRALVPRRDVQAERLRVPPVTRVR